MTAEGLGQRAFDHVDPVQRTVTLRYAGAMVAVEADRVDFIDIGHGPIALREIADRMNGRDVSIHGIEALEDDQVGSVLAGFSQQALEMIKVIVAENHLLAA